MTEQKAPAGFLNILKPPGMSSHDIVGAVRRVLHTKKVGHAGTLDPGAAGVLPVAVGPATRLIEYLEHADKSYRAEMQLGYTTASGDDLSPVTERLATFTMPTAEQVKAVLPRFMGRITQTPSAYSAIKINGQRACDRMRQGEQVEMPSREVVIHRLELLACRTADHTLLLDVDCSRGTYIRSLCTDLGQALGIPAVMTFLVRTRVGDFRLADALTLEELAEKGATALLPPAQMLSLPRYDLRPDRAKAFCNGLSTSDWHVKSLPAAFTVYADGQFLGIGKWDAAQREVKAVKVYRV